MQYVVAIKKKILLKLGSPCKIVRVQLFLFAVIVFFSRGVSQLY